MEFYGSLSLLSYMEAKAMSIKTKDAIINQQFLIYIPISSLASQGLLKAGVWDWGLHGFRTLRKAHLASWWILMGRGKGYILHALSMQLCML
jgi:hypothetical protein